MIRRTAPIPLLLALLAVSAAAAEPAEELRTLLRIRGPAAGKLGAAVLDAKTGEVLVGRDEETAYLPASAMKIVTTAVSVLELGLDYELRTWVVAAAKPDAAGELAGDLIVLGGGDPSLEVASEAGEEPGAIDRLAREVSRAGVRRVAGDLVLDDGRFDRRLRHPSWPGDQLQRWYCAPVTALTAQRSCLTVLVKPGDAVGGRGRVVLHPDTGIVRLENRITTAAKKGEQKIILDLPPGGDTLRVTGKVWKGSGGYPGEVAVPDPTAYFGDLFRRALVRHGVSVEGRTVRGPGRASEIEAPVVLATHDTPLLDLVGTTNRRSQNLFAECLLKNLGYERRKRGSFEGGAAVTAEFLGRLGFGEDAFAQADGSGLSRGNRVSALALARVLAAVYATKARNPFILTLPTGGAAEGSLRKRMKDLEVNVAAKTGTIDGVSALAGYVRARSGRMLCFAVLDNGVHWKRHPLRDARRLQDDLCRILRRGY